MPENISSTDNFSKKFGILLGTVCPGKKQITSNVCELLKLRSDNLTGKTYHRKSKTNDEQNATSN
jgi:hypothetical protein